MTSYLRLHWPDTVSECHKELMKCDKRIEELDNILEAYRYLKDDYRRVRRETLREKDDE